MLSIRVAKNIPRVVVGFVLLFSCLSRGAFAADRDDPLTCPESIKVTEKASGVDAAWQITVDKGRGGYLLDNVGFYFGHPSGMASLVPDSSDDSSGERKSIWRFPPDNSTRYWIACSYHNTRLLVTKELRAGVKTCQVNKQLLPSGAVLKIKGVTCQ